MTHKRTQVTIKTGRFAGTWVQLPLTMVYDALCIRGGGRGGSTMQAETKPRSKRRNAHSTPQKPLSRDVQLSF